jgi:hypothetical protein
MGSKSTDRKLLACLALCSAFSNMHTTHKCILNNNERCGCVEVVFSPTFPAIASATIVNKISWNKTHKLDRQGRLLS